MRFISVAAAAASAIVSSSVHAAFVFTFVVNPTSVGSYIVPAGGSSPTPAPVAGASLYAVDIYALNTGGETGTGISALNIQGTSTNPFIWLTGPTGLPNETNYNGSTFLRNGQDRSYVTLAESTTSDATFLDEKYSRANITPTNFGNLGAGGARTGAIGTFSVAGLADPIVTSNALQNGGKGLLVGHLVMPAGTASVTVSAAGSAGAATSKTQTVSLGVIVDYGIFIDAILPTTVTFGPVVTDGAPFSVTVRAITGPAGTLLNLSLGTLPAGITIDSVTGAGPTPATFTISGKAAYSLNGGSVTVPFFVASDPGGFESPKFGSFVLNIVPEPSLLSTAFVGGYLFTGRRRRSHMSLFSRGSIKRS